MGERTNQNGLLLGVDVGTNETKGVLIDQSFRPVATYAVPHTIENPQPSFYEMDAEIWWEDFCQISRNIIKEANISPESIVGIGTSVMGCDCIPVDENRKPLRKAILYGVDARSGPQIEALIKELGNEQVIKQFGRMPCSDDIAPKILWIKENEPDVYEKTYKFLTGSSYMTAKLTGQYVIDGYLAKSSFKPLYQEDGRYNALHGPRYCRGDQLASVGNVTDLAGTLTKEAAEACGLIPGTPVIVGTGDSTAESIASGLVTPGTLFVQFGSTLFYIYCVDGEMEADSNIGFPGSEPFTIPGKYVISGGTNCAGALTKWIRDIFYASEKESLKSRGINTFSFMAHEAEEVSPGSNGLIVLPYLFGERSPINDPQAKGIFFGLAGGHTRKEINRAALEGVAYSLGSHIRIFRKIGLIPDNIVIAGGGTKNKAWMQIVADVLGMPIQLAEDWQTASYGDACMAAIGCGILKDFYALKQVIPKSQVIFPNAHNHALYDRYLDIYEKLYIQNRELMHQLP